MQQEKKAEKKIVEELIEIGYTSEEALRIVKGEVKEKKEFNLEERICNMLQELGMPAHLQGFHYSRVAIEILFYAKKPGDVQITKELYPEVAKFFKTTPTRVEKNIRQAIEIALKRADTKVIEHYFKNSYSKERKRLTNSEFLITLSYILQLEEKK